MNLMSKLRISEALDADVRASKAVNFKVNNLVLIELSFGRVLIYHNTCSTSHIKAYLGAGGFLLKIPDINAETLVCCPIGVLLIGS